MQPDALKSTLASMDPGNVIFVNTFSKIFNPGVRIGWVTFPKEIDTEALLPGSIEEVSVAYGAGPSFYHNRKGKEHMRLCYSYAPESRIAEGIERLARLVSEILADVKGSAIH